MAKPFWNNNIELQVLVLLSLFLQVILIATGNRRKYTRNRWIAAILWLSYLSADSVAMLALGVLSRIHAAGALLDPSYIIMAFWAPFLLMHLGGPDTITAYALADNELWLRHLLGLISQVGVAVYIAVSVFANKSFSGKLTKNLWMVIFASGLAKYGERTWNLYLASKNQFRDSMVSKPDPGPNYAKFMDGFVSREKEGYDVSLGRAIDVDDQLSSSSVVVNPANVSYYEEATPDLLVLHEAYYFYGTFKRLFTDLILSFQDKEISLSFFRTLRWGKTFEIVEAELGLMYDLFYTNALVFQSRYGFFLRVLTCSANVAAFAAFQIIDKQDYPKTEVIITHVLLSGAVLLELYAIMIFVSSDRAMIWFSRDWTKLRVSDHPAVGAIVKIVSFLRFLHIVPARKRWSNTMGQHNLLDSCLESNTMFTNVHHYLKSIFTKVHHYLKQYLFWNSVEIPQGLKKLVFDRVKARTNSDDDPKKKSGGYRGDMILLKEMDSFTDIDVVEFDHSFLLWHIATDLCHLADDDDVSADNPNSEREISTYLSNYMVHLLIMSPSMLPSGIGQIRFQDTCAEATEFFNNQKLSKREACRKLLEVDVRVPPSEIKGDRSKSLLFDACRLAKDLEKLEVDDKWEKISRAWVDIVMFAAAQCKWNEHAEKLSQGGELLTHVWLLMAHFGMTDQFQISQGHVRAKLMLK